MYKSLLYRKTRGLGTHINPIHEMKKYLKTFTLNEFNGFLDSFNKKFVVFKEFEDFGNFQDGQIDKHTSDLGGKRVTRDLLNKREQHFSQNLSLSVII